MLADYLEVLAFLRAANDDAPPWARKSVKSMADFLARLLHPDGELPLFHNAALGVARPARELLATAAALFHEPALASAGELPGVWPLLVLGEAGRRAYANLPRRREAAEPRALRRTGFYVLPGDPGDVMLLDGGTPPPGGDPNLFGYELSVGGMRLVVDAGVGGEEPGPWGDYFRSRRAHNTVAVDAVDDRRSPEVSDVRWIMRDGLLYFAGTHDGFAHRTPALKHRRRVFCLPGRFWVIADELIGAGGVEAESFIHLHPDVRLAAVCRGRPVFTAGRSPTAQVQTVPAGWPDHEPPAGGWRGADLTGRALLLAHLPRSADPSLPVGVNEDRSVRAVLAGRLYNRRELTVALGGRHALGGRDDAEIVAHLYEERGLKSVQALRGAFALALWDARRGRLLLARDQLGLVPLYFAADGNRLAASSALPTLVALPGLAQAWDPAALDAFLTFGFVPPPATLHPAIRQLAPAEIAVWEGGRLRFQRYWHLAFPERRLGASEAAALVRGPAREAIRLRP